MFVAMFVEDSSTKIRRFGSTPLRRSLKALLESTSIFFVALGGTQRLFCSSTPASSFVWLGSWLRSTPARARLVLPKFAVALQSCIVVLFELWLHKAFFCWRVERMRRLLPVEVVVAGVRSPCPPSSS
jgi:hypothetical protein